MTKNIVYLFLTVLIFGITPVWGNDYSNIDIESGYYNSEIAYFLTESGDLFVMGNSLCDNFGDDYSYITSVGYDEDKISALFRIASNVKKISYDDKHSILYVIKNDNSLWVRGYNIYLTAESSSANREFTKIDDDVEDVCFCDSDTEFWLYKKTDSSLWAIGNSSELSEDYKADCIPVKITENVKSATNGSRIFILYNDSSLYVETDSGFKKISDNVKEIRSSNGYGYDFEFVLTEDNDLYIINEDTEEINTSALISDSIVSFENYHTSWDNTIIYTIKIDGSLHKEHFTMERNSSSIFDKTDEVILENVKAVKTNGAVDLILLENGDLYENAFDYQLNKYNMVKADGSYTRLFNSFYALNTEGIAVMFDDNYKYAFTDFDFNNALSLYADKSFSTWAENTIIAAEAENLVPPVLQKRYTNSITRKEFCRLAITMLMNKLNTNTDKFILDNNIELNVTRFTDTKNSDVLLAEALGIVSGYSDNSFKPNNSITREEAAVLLKSLADLTEIKSENNNVLFDDDGEIGSWAREAVYSISSISDNSGNTVMTGTGSNKFSPKLYYTREQAIATIYRLYNAK